jgi:hypothetical protein
MEQEREDYADHDLPPPRKLPPLHIIFALLGLALLAAMVAAAVYQNVVGVTRD